MKTTGVPRPNLILYVGVISTDLIARYKLLKVFFKVGGSDKLFVKYPGVLNVDD